MPLFGFDAAPLRARARLGFAAELGCVQRGADQRGQAFARVGAILRLGAKTLGGDHQFTGGVDAGARKLDQARAHVRRQSRRSINIEPQLDGGRNFVDILAARTRCAHELLVEFAVRDGYVRRYLEHAPSYSGLMFAALTTLPHLIISARRKLASSSGALPAASAPALV